MKSRIRVLFLCTGNSCRSQMAEAWLRQLGGESFESASAGTHPVGVNPLAVRVMAERGVDLARAESKHVDSLAGTPFDFVVTVCGDAEERCPAFPGGTRRLHWPFDDPARAAGNDEERLGVFRRVRDEIAERVRAFVGEMAAPAVADGETGWRRC